MEQTGVFKHQTQGPEEEEKSTGVHSVASSSGGQQQQSSQFSFGADGSKEDAPRLLNNLELIKKAEECADKLKLEKAISLYDEGIRRWPNDTLIIDQYSDLLIQFGEVEKAKELIQRSIQLNPNKDGQKYLNLAEMLKGQEAIQIYRKGIEVLSSDYERHSQAQNLAQATLVKKQISSSLASIAESYMTEPLCDEPDAEAICEKSLKDALAHDQSNLDALQCLANLRMLRNKDDEAKELLSKVVEQIMALQAQHVKATTVSELMKPQAVKATQSEMPSVDFRMQTSRFLVDLQVFRPALKLLEAIIGEDDEQVEAWYLLAFCLHKLQKFRTCQECANNVVSLIQKFKILNPDLEAGTEEILRDCKKQIDKESQAQVEVVKGKDAQGDDSGFETMSEENVSSEGEDAEMKE